MSRARFPCFLFGLLAALVCLPLSAAAWVPVDCDAHPKELEEWRQQTGVARDAWARYEQGVRKARPGDPVFAPRPYPTRRDEIVEDFLYGYFEIFFPEAGDVEKEERPVYEGLRDGAIRIEVERVENWGVRRCGTNRHVPYFHLLRLFDREGKEVSRGVLDSSGLLSRYGRLRPESRKLPEPDQAGSILRQRYGLDLKVSRPQLVVVDGLASPCQPENPCLAFQAGGRVWIVENGWFSNGLYEVLLDAPRMSMTAWREQQAERGIRLGEVDREQPLVSVGFAWAQARRVAEPEGDPE